MNKVKVYKIFYANEDFEMFCGETQLCEFAQSRISDLELDVKEVFDEYHNTGIKFEDVIDFKEEIFPVDTKFAEELLEMVGYEIEIHEIY